MLTLCRQDLLFQFLCFSTIALSSVGGSFWRKFSWSFLVVFSSSFYLFFVLSLYVFIFLIYPPLLLILFSNPTGTQQLLSYCLFWQQVLLLCWRLKVYANQLKPAAAPSSTPPLCQAPSPPSPSVHRPRLKFEVLQEYR